MIKEINNTKLIEELFNKIFKTKLSTNIYSKILIYEDEKEIVGFIIYDLIYDRCELEYIGVCEEKRNNKIASKLMEEMINDTLKNNIQNISLEVNENNKSAIKLYEKYNFVVKAKREKYYQNEDAYLMVREV